MELVSVKVEGYRRFSKPSELELSGRVVALVGPNEAGKSSLLQAVKNFASDDEMPDQFKSRVGDAEPTIEAFYFLEDSDRNAIAEFEGGGSVRWWSCKKISDGGYRFSLHPQPQRSLEQRHQLGSSLSQLIKLAQYLVHSSRDGEFDDESVSKAWEVLNSSEQNLDETSSALINAAGQALIDLSSTLGGFENPFRDNMERVGTEMESYEEGPDPHEMAGRKLCQRLPKVYEFRDIDRNLRSSYILSQDLTEDPPQAFANFCDLADIDLQHLWELIDSADRGRRIKFEEEANKRLKSEFSNVWRQSKAIPRIAIEGDAIAIVISAEDNSTYTEIEERSDGFIWFIALIGFLKKRETSEPIILLVDEAEQHLHYDAQADLVRVFTQQDLVSKIIYTTHSAGCLPHDLGTGVRPIVPVRGTQTSTILKSLWSKTEAGFSPLAIAMGATSFAFLPARFVLFCEGASDALLLPSIFRELLNCDRLDFQVCPGIAVTNPASYKDLLTQGGAVNFVLDGDDEGRNYREQLTRAGVGKECIFSFDEHLSPGTVLEDLLDKSLYCEAVNSLIRDFDHDSSISIQPEILPETNSPARVAQHLSDMGTIQVAKVDVATRVLDLHLRVDRGEKTEASVKLVRREAADSLRKLVESIANAYR